MSSSDTTQDMFSPEHALIPVIQDFQQNPSNYIKETQLHAKFFSSCSNVFAACDTIRDEIVGVRYMYPTRWRYEPGEHYAQRYESTGRLGVLDFVFMEPTWDDCVHYMNVHFCGDAERIYAFELKMMPFKADVAVSEADINLLQDRMLDSCRKFVQEDIEFPTVVGFGRGALLDLQKAKSTVAMCLALYQSRQRARWSHVNVAVVTPTDTVLGGRWGSPEMFPNVSEVLSPNRDEPGTVATE